MGALEAANSRGLTVGRELAIAGFDGIEELAYTHPPLTTLTQPLYDIARRLVKMLVAEIAGQPLEERHVLIQPELVVREFLNWLRLLIRRSGGHVRMPIPHTARWFLCIPAWVTR